MGWRISHAMAGILIEMEIDNACCWCETEAEMVACAQVLTDRANQLDAIGRLIGICSNCGRSLDGEMCRGVDCPHRAQTPEKESY